MDRLPRDYERQIAKKRLPGLLSAIAAAENRAATLPEEKGHAEAGRARSLRAVVAQLLTDLGEEGPPSPPPAPSRRRASAGTAQAATSAPGPAPASPDTTAPLAPGPAPTPPSTVPPPAEPDPAPAPASQSPPAAVPSIAPMPAAPLPQQTAVPQTTRTQEAGPQKLRRSTP